MISLSRVLFSNVTRKRRQLSGVLQYTVSCVFHHALLTGFCHLRHMCMHVHACACVSLYIHIDVRACLLRCSFIQ